MRAKVLFPTDLSPWSLAALPTASRQAARRDATLLIVHVCEPAPPDSCYQGSADYVREASRIRLAQITPADPQLEYEHRLLEGFAAAELLRLLQTERIELVVLAARYEAGASPYEASVDQLLVEAGHCPVVAVLAPEGRTAPQSAGA